jgi:hypothetical protein
MIAWSPPDWYHRLEGQLDIMVNNTLFDLLDINHDNNLSRSELLLAAKRLGWHWYEAPLLALLDLMTIREPITRTQFTAIIQQIQNDPLGPYGDVLLKLPHFDKNSSPAIDQPRSRQRFSVKSALGTK